MFEGFPYTNFHELNLDWIIKIARDFLDQYTNIQQTITQGLEDLDTKAEQLQALLDAWYEEHSEDIAQQLTAALQDLNDWYTLHENYLNDTLIENIGLFNTRADEKTAQCIAEIPADYTELSNEVTQLLENIEYITESTINKWIWGDFLNFTTSAEITEILIPAGTYMFSAEITSDDTSQTSSAMYLYDENDNITTVNLNRNTRSGRTVTVPNDIVKIRLYSSTSYSSSNGKVASWRNIGIFPNGTRASFYIPPITAVDWIARDDLNFIEDIYEATSNIWTLGDWRNFETSVNAGLISFPAGTYMISAVITSTDTDATSSKMVLHGANNETFDVYLNRNTRSGRTVTVPFDVVSATLYASNAAGASAGDTASWVDIGIFPNGTPAAYYVPHFTATDWNAREKIGSVATWEKSAKIVWFGTSIPAGGVGGRYPNIIAAKLGVNIYNESIGSSRAKAGYLELISSANPLGVNSSFNDTIKAMGYTINDKQLFISNYDNYKPLFNDNPPEYISVELAQEIIGYSFERKLYRYLNNKESEYNAYSSSGFVGDVDLYVLDHGYNDFMTNTVYPSDTIIPDLGGPNEMYYFAGAIDRYIQLIMQNNIHSKILLISHYSETDKGGRIVRMQNEIAEKWKLPIVRVYETIGWTNIQLTINGETKTVKNWWIPDGIHPSSDPTGTAIRKYVEILLPEIRNILYPIAE